ncbi:hypothetical protein [Gracilinema caldarium]|uniref:Uncharacterized protein n=1 Tax=Gracilinema caldarium (strain ATCC 51460 / DSM 7334 / H1) TaxID=744872 RepID=F8F1K8_GRAC1|nr:hypothetical protein [Gracilinema caldarium]AEJ19061.1 hypothetical protein Spica_0911 [Gracilinema caldarium DSM 7334]
MGNKPNSCKESSTDQAKDNEVSREERREVVVIHSTDESGEAEPRRPGGGKGSPEQRTDGGKHGGHA